MARLIGLLVVGLAIAFAPRVAIAEACPKGLQSNSSNLGVVEDFISKFLGEFDQTIPQLRKQGVIRVVRAKRVRNIHEPKQYDERLLIVGKGLRYEAEAINRNRRDLRPLNVTLSTPNWDIPDGLQVGASTEQLHIVLGEPNAVVKGQLVYFGEFWCVVFSHRDQQLTQIFFGQYVDSD